MDVGVAELGEQSPLEQVLYQIQHEGPHMSGIWNVTKACVCVFSFRGVIPKGTVGSCF